MSDAGARPVGAHHDMAGIIASSGFESGDRVVVGHWWRSPIGPFTDVMWCEPDGVRVLLAPDEAVARFVTSVYRFDRLEVVPFETWSGPRLLVVRAGDREVRFDARHGVGLPFVRPRWFTRWVEGPIARVTFGVRTYGVSPTGVQEWYRARSWHPLRHASATVGRVDLGAPGPVDPPARFGFTEPPRHPSFVRVHPSLRDPSGRLDVVLAGMDARLHLAPTPMPRGRARTAAARVRTRARAGRARG